METKVFKAGDFVLLYVEFITSFDSDQQFDSDQLRIKLLAGRGYSPMYVTGICAAKKDEVCWKALVQKQLQIWTTTILN